MHDIAAIAVAEANMEEDLFQDEEYDLGLIASVIIIGAEISRQAHICQESWYFLFGSSYPDTRF